MMKYNVYIDNTRVGTAETLGTQIGGRRLSHVFGTIATEGLADRERDCKFDIDWHTVDELHGSWELRKKG